MTDFVQDLRKLFSENSNESYGEKMSQYMKNHFVFFGINSPLRTALFKQFCAENEPPQYNALREVVLELWLEPERELQYCAIELLERCKKEWTEDMIHLFEELIVTKSWWDSVDGVAPLVGLYFKKFPHQTRPITEVFWIQTWRFNKSKRVSFWILKAKMPPFLSIISIFTKI